MTIWQDQAACRNTVTRGVVAGPDADPFFPSGDEGLAALGKAYCAVCPVRRECRAEFETVPYKVGVWAGVEHGKPKLTRRPEIHDGPDVAMHERRRLMHAQGFTDREMAEAETVSVSAIQRWRAITGLHPNKSAYRARNNTKERRLEWHSWGWTDQQIAEHDHIKVATVTRWRERQHLPANPKVKELNQRTG